MNINRSLRRSLVFGAAATVSAFASQPSAEAQSQQVDGQLHLACSHMDPTAGPEVLLVEWVDSSDHERRVQTRADAELLREVWGARVLHRIIETTEDGLQGSRASAPCSETRVALAIAGSEHGTLVLSPAGDVLFRVDGHTLRLEDKLALLESFGVVAEESGEDLQKRLIPGLSLPEVVLVERETGTRTSLPKLGDGRIVLFAGSCAPCSATQFGRDLDHVSRRSSEQGKSLHVVFTTPVDELVEERLGLAAVASYVVVDRAMRVASLLPENRTASEATVIDVANGIVLDVRDLRQVGRALAKEGR